MPGFHYRYDDTDFILREYSENLPETERRQKAVHRLNAIHGMYAKQISNGDMLYTLSLFVTEPARWIDRYRTRAKYAPIEMLKANLSKSQSLSYIIWCAMLHCVGLSVVTVPPGGLYVAVTIFEYRCTQKWHTIVPLYFPPVRYEWRRTTDLEKAAILGHFRKLGELMGIKGVDDWKTWNDVCTFQHTYEVP